MIDTSAWIEFLRDTGSPACMSVDRLLDEQIAISDAISMEVLAGARDDTRIALMRRASGWRPTVGDVHRPTHAIRLNTPPRQVGVDMGASLWWSISVPISARILRSAPPARQHIALDGPAYLLTRNR